MGTHPIFESDFDCLTDRIMDFINKKAVPDVELSEEDLDALGSLSKTNVKGMQFNPYTKIDPKYMDLNNAIESDDDDEWFYATDEQKPRNRSEKLFLNVGSATVIGGGVGLLGAMGSLRRSDLLKRAAFTHKVKRGTMINTIVGRVRERSGQFGSFGFFIGGIAALCDMEWTKNLTMGGMPVGGVVRQMNVQQTAALGGVAFGMVGSKFYSQDMSRKKVNLMRQFPEFPAGKPAFYELNNRIEYWTLSRCITKDTCPRYLNMLTGTGRLATLGAAAFSMTAGLDWMNTTKIGWIRDLKRWKW